MISVHRIVHASRHISCLVLTVALLVPIAIAKKKDAEAASLIERAKQLSDIRAEGAPPFRLKLSFKIIEDDGLVLDGAYTEIWVSKAKWRRETVLRNFRRTQVAEGRRLWLLDSTSAVPEHISDIPRLSEADRFGPEVWKPGNIEDRKIKGLDVRCLETTPDHRGAISALCFDKSSGALVVQVSPLQVETRIADNTCFFADYQEFGNRVLARSYECHEDKHPKLQARIVELVVEPTPDPAMFVPLEGGKESVNCLSGMKPPKATHQQSPSPPNTSHGRNLVLMSLIVGTDGKPHDLRVTSAPNHDFDRVALEAARLWRFKPATCDVEPVETEIGLDIDFTLQ
jgi:TonB family protein